VPVPDNDGRPLLRGTLWAVGGTGFYYACQLGVLVLLAKFASPSIQGQYVLALALATPVVLFFGLELRSAFVSDAGQQFPLGTYFALRRRSLLGAAVVLLGVLAWQAAGTEPSASYLLILVGVFAARILWAWADLGWGVYQRRERLDLLGVSVGLRGVALLAPFALLLPLYAWLKASGRIPAARLADGAALAALVHALAFGILWLAFDRPRVVRRASLAASLGSAGASPPLRGLALQTLPLGVVALVINLCDTFPRVVIERQPDGRALLGYFGALAYITLAGNLVVIQASTAAANRLARFYQQDFRAFLRLGARLIAIAAGIGAGVLVIAVLLGRWILSTLYTAEYARFETEFRIIVLAQCLALLTNVFGAATTQMRLFWLQVPAQVLTLLATVIAALVLIPGPRPVLGAAETVLVRAGVQFCLYATCVGVGLARKSKVKGKK
jgi:O-antigen/teichoic acid export membrane protein